MTVIIHGDMHTGNILIKSDGGQVKLIDWQFTRLASPVTDLMYFFIKCIPIDSLAANENDLLDFYLTSLNSVLSLYEYKRQDLNNDMFHYRYNYVRFLVVAYDQGTNEDREKWLLNLANWLIYLERKAFI